MSSAIKILPHYTYEDYCQWEGNWEVIEGIPYAMSPTPVPRHQLIAGNIYSEFKQALKKEGCDCKVYLPIDYKISEDTIVQPDILIACKPVTKKFIDFPPALVVEILSPSTAMKDRTNKFSLYEMQQILYYLIVDGDNNSIEVYQLNASKKYMRQNVNQKEPYNFMLETNCHASILFDNIWEK